MNCTICGAKLKKNIKLNGLLKCPKCKFICANMDLSDLDFAKLYSEKYFSGDEYTDYISDHKLHAINFNQKIHRIEKVVGDLTGLKCFEIGSAYGFFLEQAQKHFAYCSGIDISEDAITYARKVTKVNVTSGDFLSATINFTPNIICMWDTIEHLSMPKEFVTKAYSLLSTNGYLCITTGDIGSLNARLRGRKWRQIHPPTHLQYFSRTTLSRLLNTCGFKILDISYPSNRMSLRNIYYSIFCLRMKKTKWYIRHKDNPILDLSIPINLHDYMFIIAQKR